jgi:hypothetical protein
MARVTLPRLDNLWKYRRIVVLAAFLAALLVFGAIWLALGLRSYEHPGPASAAAGLALVVFLVGLALQDLQSKNSELTDQLAEARLALHELQDKNSELTEQAAQLRYEFEIKNRIAYHLPRIIGLELLINRWQGNRAALDPQDSETMFEQLRIVLSTVHLDFSDAKTIRFIKAYPGTKIERGVFLVQCDEDPPLVLKIDRIDNIHAEEHNYHAHVRPHLGQTPGEPIKRSGRGRIGQKDWSAITYSLIGASNPAQLQTLGEFIRSDHKSEHIQAALEQVFVTLRGPWWRPIKQPALPLYDEYERLVRNYGKVQSSLRRLGRTLQIGQLERINADVPSIALGDHLILRNPLSWISGVFEAQKLDEWATDHAVRRDSIIHGDFHTSNILISEGQDGSLRAWLIDFPHTRIGPTIQDIARLEIDIKFGLLPIEALDDTALYELESCLLPPVNQPIAHIGTMPPDQMFKNAWRAIEKLRAEAQKYMIGIDARPYYLALLHATLPALYYRDRTDKQKLYALISAALLCERLGG